MCVVCGGVHGWGKKKNLSLGVLQLVLLVFNVKKSTVDVNEREIKKISECLENHLWLFILFYAF